MTLNKRTLSLIPLLFFVSQAIGQMGPPLRLPGWLSWLPKHSMHSSWSHNSLGDLPARRWLLSFNPLGLLEVPGAIGMGVGYRLSRSTEIWSETSLLQNFVVSTLGKTTGLRQILQVKVFPRDRRFFLALEFRYKYFSYPDTNSFASPVTHDTIRGVSFQSNHTIFGAGLQIGSRVPLSRDGRLQLEYSIGLGVKDKIIHRVGPPNGYGYLGTGMSIDLDVRDLIETSGWLPYFPGSVRILYTFGKKLK